MGSNSPIKMLSPIPFHFFQNLIGTPASTLDIGINWDHLYPVDNRASLMVLEETFTEKEIRRAIFSLGPDKAPGHDGFNMRFYQHFWLMLQQDFIDILHAFFGGNLDLSKFDRAYIVLIPKLAGARRTRDIRPISSINGILKIVSKVLTNILK